MKGAIVIDPHFDDGLQFSEGLAAVSVNGKWGSGLCLVTTEDEIGYIAKTGEFVWKGPYVESRIGLDLRM